MILEGLSIERRGILDPCHPRTEEGLLGKLSSSYGLGPAGYDLRLDLGEEWVGHYNGRRTLHPGEFVLAAAQERFTMPDDLVGIVHDKSSLARLGMSVFNTVIEPGWRGFLTLELVNHGQRHIDLWQGMGIAQVIFHQMTMPASRPYDGKYQDQAAGPQEAR